MKLIYKCLNFNSYSFSSALEKHFDNLSDGGRFYCNLGRAFSVESYIPRKGIWSDPFDYDILDHFFIPESDILADYTFEEITDRRVLDLKKKIELTDQNVVVYYSGGIDSTVVMCALLKNLDQQYLNKISIAMSSDSILENPYFYKNFIESKFKIVDSNRHLYSDFLFDGRQICVTADLGDFIYGTELGIKFYLQMPDIAEQLKIKNNKDYSELFNLVHDSNTHYSNYRDLLIFYFDRCLQKGIRKLENTPYISKKLCAFKESDYSFGELFYEKINFNINSVDNKIQSLHDFFWWTMFNLRYIWGAMRPLVSYASLDNIQHHFNDNLINWYGSADYQIWSMNNNNNGQKMSGSAIHTYKQASKRYIYDFDKNHFYLNNKLKMPSSPIIIARNYKSNFNKFDGSWAVDSDYNIVTMKKPGVDDYVMSRLLNHCIDWLG